LGVALIETGKVDEAMAHYREAVTLNPQFAEAYNNLAEALAGRGSAKESIANFKKAVQLDAGYTIARANLGMLLIRTGQTDEAVVHLKKVVEATPDAVDARRSLGQALADRGDLQAASIQLEKAASLSAGKDPLTLYFLARVYGDLGRLPEAAQIEVQALALATQQNNAQLIDAITAHRGQIPPPQPNARQGARQ
jgi:tetratricopeptide (TPR) repeat protein